METLVTGWGREEGQQTGRTACHRIVWFEGGAQTAQPGELVTLRIDRARHHSLLGTRLDIEAAMPPIRRSPLRVLPGA
jgi:tRNA A37 methylthiotransferase MiaB